MTTPPLAVRALLDSPEPVALDVDLDALADGEDGAGTDRAGAGPRAGDPLRRRQCASGLHGECSDKEGEEGCSCSCHLLLARLHHDHRVLHQVRRAVDEVAVSVTSRYDAWACASDLLELGWMVEDARGEAGEAAAVAPPSVTRERRDVVSELLYGERGEDGEEHVNELLTALAANGVRLVPVKA